MTSEKERVTIRLPANQLNALQSLVDSGAFANMSDAIRAAIEAFVEVRFAPDYIRKLTIDLPSGNVVQLESLVQSGDSVSVEDAIRNAVREYVMGRLAQEGETSGD
jgi:Arc/MetJ-type ribon-helix-helix transcriptional regulator